LGGNEKERHDFVEVTVMVLNTVLVYAFGVVVVLTVVVVVFA